MKYVFNTTIRQQYADITFIEKPATQTEKEIESFLRRVLQILNSDDISNLANVLSDTVIIKNPGEKSTHKKEHIEEVRRAAAHFRRIAYRNIRIVGKDSKADIYGIRFIFSRNSTIPLAAPLYLQVSKEAGEWKITNIEFV